MLNDGERDVSVWEDGGGSRFDPWQSSGTRSLCETGLSPYQNSLLKAPTVTSGKPLFDCDLEQLKGGAKMPYKVKNEQGQTVEKFTLKERHKFHKEIADGKRQVKDFETGQMRPATSQERIRAGIRADKRRAELNQFMSQPKEVRDGIVKASKARSRGS